MRPLAIAAVAALLASPAAAAESRPSAARAELERLKALAGTWKGKAGEAGAPQQNDATVTFRVTGAGSAVVETIDPGGTHEMITVYHLDGDRLQLTHYCAAGNQPTMRAVKSGSADTLAFDFLRGSNMKPGDMHMHAARIRFLDGDHVVSEWTSWQGGKRAGVMRFELAREK